MNLKYFFTKEYCSCPLNSLSPEEIKKSYSNELSKYDIKKVRYLNLVSKTLGFQDWTNYQKEYTNKLLPFLKENELKVYAPNNRINILKSKHGDINFSYRKIADRIFLSNQPMPKKIFTGYGCKIDNFLINYRLPPIIINDKIFTNIDELHKDRKDIVSLIKSEIYCNIKENLELDYLITSLSIFISLQNLIGDTFIIDDKKEKEHIGCLYQNKIGLSQEYDFQEIGDIFHKQLLEMNKGWIEIIPFNNNLIFLKASDGNYDFIYKNLREKPFISEFGKYIRTKNIPSLTNEKYDFERWLYFGLKEKNKKPKDITPFDIWFDRDLHLAEIEYYKNNILQNYPSQNNILKDYFSKKGIYSYYKKETKKILAEFKPVVLKDKVLYVSNLITIKEFNEFSISKDKDNQNYLETRLDTLENISTLNTEDDKDLPVSVTWYDAIAYCKYIENKYNVPARLLFQDEFEKICPQLIYKKYNREDINMNLNDKLNKSYTPLEFTENNGLIFCINERFNEWTNEFENGNSKLVSAKYHIDKNYWCLASSTLKYKYRKVGFRVCYETTKDIK